MARQPTAWRHRAGGAGGLRTVVNRHGRDSFGQFGQYNGARNRGAAPWRRHQGQCERR